MKIPTHTKTAVFILLILLTSCASKHFTKTQKPMQVFLVRHAEKMDYSKDPSLSADGLERSLLLARILRDSEIEYVHSSDYIRTRDTATPFADAQELEVELYDPKNLPILVEKLLRKGGRHLVVGHSNTTPLLVELLGGKPGAEMNEEREYDRLYIVTVAEDRSVDSIILRFGNMYNAKQH